MVDEKSESTIVRTPAKDVKIVGVDIEFWPLTQLLIKLIYAGFVASVVIFIEVSLLWVVALVLFGEKASALLAMILSIFS